MIKRLNKTEATIVGLSQIVVMFGTILSLKVFTNLLPISEYSLFALAQAAIIGSQFIFNPIANALRRYLPIAQSRLEIKSYFNALNLLIRSSFLFIVLTIFILNTITNIFDITNQFKTIYLLGFLLGATSGMSFWGQSILIAERRRSKVLLFDILTYLLKPLIAISAIFIFGFRADVILYTFLFVNIFTLFYVSNLVKNEFKSSLNKNHLDKNHRNEKTNYLNKFFKFSSYFFIAGIVVAAILQTDRWIINEYLGLQEVGLYSVMFAIANGTTSFVFSSISNVMTPVIYQRVGNDRNKSKEGMESYKNYIKILLLIITSLVLFKLLFGKQIVLLLTSETYLSAVKILPLLTISMSLEKIGQAFTMKGFIGLRTWPYLWTRIVQFLVLLIIGFYSIEKYGINGIAYAQIFSSLAYLLLVLVTNQIICKQELKAT